MRDARVRDTESVPASHYTRYEQLVVPTFATPFLEAALAPVVERSPATALDLACGTGATTRSLRRALPDARVTGADVDPWAVRYARQLSDPSVGWVVGSASALPIATGSMGAVVCQQGAQFFADVPSACHELRRVLHPGGVASLVSWTPDGAALFRVLDEALAAAGSPSPRYARPLSFDVDRWSGTASDAGLAVRSVDVVEARFSVGDIDALVAHFVEPTDQLAERACSLAGANARVLLESGDTLRAFRLVLAVDD